MADLVTPSANELSNGGQPETLTIRKARSVGAYFADGATILNANTYTVVTPIAGALAIRLRGKFTCAGSMTLLYRRPPLSVEAAGTTYSNSLTPPTTNPVAISADTEFLINIEPVGEPYLEIKFDPSADGVVNFLDILSQ